MPRVRKLAALESIIVEGYRLGSTIELMAATHNVSPGTIRSILVRNGVTIRKQGRQKRAENL